MSNSDNLKNFISKLNDRNLQRKRESGITSYVLYSALIFCIYKLYKNTFYYIQNLSELDFLNVVHIICFTSNSLIAVYFIILAFQSEKKTLSNLKVIKYDKDNFNILSYMAQLIYLAIPILSISYLFIKKPEYLTNYYYIFLGLLNIITLISLFEPIFSAKKQLKVHIKEESPVWIVILIILISLTVIYLSILHSFEIEIYRKFIFIKISIIFYTILFILEKIAEQEKNDISTFNLENFEYEIYLKNLNDEQIRQRLQENYIGYLIEYWIDFNNRELDKIKADIDSAILKKDQLILELDQAVDQNLYPIEYKGRKKKIILNFNKTLGPSLPKLIKILNDVSKILRDGNNLTELEIKQLSELKTELSTLISQYKEGGQ